MPTLRALECLVAVADSGSITEAAQRLHSSQPAVSH
jgi:DNA-binding transcriptional LysR family regulator